MTPVSVIAALFLPPLAIFLNEGIGRNFWIGVALTCVGFLPEVIFAFVTLMRARPAAEM